MRIRPSVLAALFVLSASSFSTYARDCIRTGSICSDAAASKVFSGITVTLAQAGGCWEYTDTYTCIKPNAVNYCQPFVNLQPQCWQTSTQCAVNDTVIGTGCMTYSETWRCTDPALPTPTNTIRLDSTYTLVSSNYDPTPCAALDSSCSIASSTCTSSTPPSLPPGISSAQVAPDGCYQRTNTYACLTGQSDTSECTGYSTNPKCTLQGSACAGDTINNQCTMSTKTYRCETTPASSATVTDCSGQQFRAGGGCFNKGAPSDTDFARTMALMEAARQGGVYGAEAEIFKGFDSRCTKKLFGLANCCKKSGGSGGTSNAALAVGGASQAGKLFGSPYMYDAMFASDVPFLMERAVDAWSATAWTSSTSFYGLSFSFSPVAGLQFVGFDPYSFAFQVGLMILSDLLSCEQSEQITAMRRDQNLCMEVGTFCSNELNLLIAKICLEHTTTFCCYNSRLARIINQQAKPQIGKGWGSAESPNCSGFTQAEFAAIDFSRIDLTEFTAEIMANIKMPNVGTMSQQIQTSIQQKVQNYYQR